MNLPEEVLIVVTIAANAGAAGADIARVPFVLKTSDEVHVARTWLPLLATLKAAGAAGLLLGLLGVRSIGIAAAAGVVLFFIGAVAAHVRAKAFHNIAFPGAYLALAVACLVVLNVHS